MRFPKDEPLTGEKPRSPCALESSYMKGDPKTSASGDLEPSSHKVTPWGALEAADEERR